MASIPGYHIIAELHNCPREKLERADTLKEILLEISRKAGFESVGSVFYQFEPFGATGVVLIKTSHISAHTWPEHGYVALDIYSCAGSKLAEKALELSIKKFEAGKVKVKRVRRFR